MWSVGCIFGECLSFTDDYISQGGREIMNRVLFPGSSCYPISPSNQSKNAKNFEPDTLKISENDQFIKILEQVGPLCKDDSSFLSKKSIIEYVD